ncbi:MAG TPA: thioredoxin [Beijerinckiaceae bacterium]|nr:thioredoxin [Beijerinckiaceae bacterium]
MMQAGGTATDALIRETTTAAFRQDVIAESAKQPVLVDFWAPWCGPCRQLTPVIEKVVKAAGGKVKLVKMNIDDHPQVAGQMGIQSIPAVIAFSKGQPVDGFMGALPESQVKTFIERLVGPLGAGGTAELLKQAAAAAESGDHPGAAELFAAVLAQEPENLQALGGLAKVQLDAGSPEQARRLIDTVPPAKHADPAIASVLAALELAERAASLGDLVDLERRIAVDPADHQARFDLAVALNSKGFKAEAADHLLEIIRRDRSWNEDGARKQLLQLFEAWGPMDEVTIGARRKLSAYLFR